MTILFVIVAFLVGGCFGTGFMALFQMSSKHDEQYTRAWNVKHSLRNSISESRKMFDNSHSSSSDRQIADEIFSEMECVVDDLEV